MGEITKPEDSATTPGQQEQSSLDSTVEESPQPEQDEHNPEAQVAPESNLSTSGENPQISDSINEPGTTVSEEAVRQVEQTQAEPSTGDSVQEPKSSEDAAVIQNNEASESQPPNSDVIQADHSQENTVPDQEPSEEPAPATEEPTQSEETITPATTTSSEIAQPQTTESEVPQSKESNSEGHNENPQESGSEAGNMENGANTLPADKPDDVAANPAS